VIEKGIFRGIKSKFKLFIIFAPKSIYPARYELFFIRLTSFSKKNIMKKSISALCLMYSIIHFLLIFDLHAQRTGNIVEIFGRERVETTSEGVIIHEFTEGLALRNGMRPGMLTGMQDIIYWQIATDRFERPEAGKILSDNYNVLPQEFVWESIEVDTAGFFRGNLSRAYVYNEFDSPQAGIALLDATGHTRVFINGMPQEGDHYDYGHTLIPFHLKKGLNQFVYTYGRFGRVKSQIVIPEKELQFSPRDMTLPSIIRDENDEKWGAIRVVNASERTREGLTIICTLENGETASYQTGNIMPMAVRKLNFKIPALTSPVKAQSISATLVLKDSRNREIDRTTITVKINDADRHHERTFLSGIDGSVQYYSVAPSTSDAPNQAFVLSVHGASVEATNQARAYRQKDWAHIVAPTNRRPFGFNWEEWGRLDALEVLHEARKIFHTDTSRTYLTGHSMGGHGSWILGATYPDKWAAVAPAAGYADIIGYRRTGTDSLIQANPHFGMIYRGALAGRTLDLARNYLQSGIYILHGDADAVVPVEQARLMRGILGGFHTNFAYYEYPDGSHWYGDHSMDWPPLFDFLRQNTIPDVKDVRRIEFHTASPGVSARNYWLRINQQIRSYEHSSVNANYRNDTIHLDTENIEHITVLLSLLQPEARPLIKIDGKYIVPTSADDISLRLINGVWTVASSPPATEKTPERNGGFKLAFTNNVVLVYGTRGNREENLWYENKARYDAETFLYRGNGSIEVISDREFSPEKYKDRNVIIYGNANTNRAWRSLLRNAPVQVTSQGISIGDTYLESDRIGTYFIYPRPDSDIASVGVVAGTGIKGMKATYPNDYFSGITGFPDLMIFDVDWLKEGVDGIKVSGFFGNDWSVENGDFRF
jgi:pimeloyl-ACP methyl ester carboxylesterase